MNRDSSHRIAARIGVLKLRSLLVADAHIGLRQRQELVDLTSGLIDEQEAVTEYKERIIELIKARFGRNPDTSEISGATAAALRILDAI